MAHLTEMLNFILSRAREEGFDPEAMVKIELASEEALVNVIRYSYADGVVGNIEIFCEVHPQSHLRVTIRDEGTPFNPLAKVEGFDPEAILQSGAEGGFGIFLMTQMMDHTHYQREEGHNVLTLIKNLSKNGA